MRIKIEDELTGIIALTKELTLISNLEAMLQFSEEPESTKQLEQALKNSRLFVRTILDSGVIPDLYLQRIDIAMNPVTEFYLDNEEPLYTEDMAITDSVTAIVAITKAKDTIKSLEKTREYCETDEELKALEYSINHSEETIQRILKLGYLDHEQIKLLMEAANPSTCLYINTFEE